SRRRHTRCYRDWSSDVCSSDLIVVIGSNPGEEIGEAAGDVMNTAARIQGGAPINGIVVGELTYQRTKHAIEYREAEPVVAKGKKIGRASCRERGENCGVSGWWR